MIKTNFKNLQSGYTLVETLVAISIFSIAILGLLVTLTQGIADTGYAKKKITAAYLAQEGMEYVRNLRDTQVAYSTGSADAGWSAFRDNLFNRCRVACYVNADNLNYADATQPILDMAITTCSGTGRSGCPEMRYSSAGKYNYTSGGSSGFTREIVVSRITSDELKVVSNVYWLQGSGTYSVGLTESLFNWIE